MRVHSAVSSLTQTVISIASQTQLTLQLYRARPDILTQLHRSYLGHYKIHQYHYTAVTAGIATYINTITPQ
jgi:hypothetical protein